MSAGGASAAWARRVRLVARAGGAAPRTGRPVVVHTPMVAADLGLTHVAFPVTDVDASAAFYARYADMQVVHRRVDGAGERARSAWSGCPTSPARSWSC